MKAITILEIRISELESSMEKKKFLLKDAKEQIEKDEAIIKYYQEQIQEIKNAISELKEA